MCLFALFVGDWYLNVVLGYVVIDYVEIVLFVLPLLLMIMMNFDVRLCCEWLCNIGVCI